MTHAWKTPVLHCSLMLGAVAVLLGRWLTGPTRSTCSAVAERGAGIAAPRSRDGSPTKSEPAQVVERAAGDLKSLDARARAAAQAMLPTVVAVRNPAAKPSSPGDRYQHYASGVIVTAEGIVLSQWHVSHSRRPSDGKGATYAAGEKTTIVLNDGRECPAELLGANRTHDISMLRLLPPGPYPHVPICIGPDVRVGDWVLKIGHPLGYRRDRAAPVRLGRVLGRVDDIFVTDCALCGGDSGGPYFSLDGKLVGVASHTCPPNKNLDPHDPLLDRRTGALFSVTGNRILDSLLDAMRGGEVSPYDLDERSRIDRQLRAAACLRTADWSQGNATLAQYRSMVAPARSSVVAVLHGGVPVALGTVVGTEGWVLTKASELPADPVCRLPDGRTLAARVVGAEPAFDLALLRLPANGLHPIAWADKFDPAIGTLLAAAGPQEQPLAVGVVSVRRRNMAPSEPAYTLPIRLPAGRPEICRPLHFGFYRPTSDYTIAGPRGVAWAAGIRGGDVLREINGRHIREDRDLIEAVKGRRTGDVVPVHLERDGKPLTLRLPLRPEAKSPYAGENYRADDFPTVFDCAVPFFSHECGGPVVDLTGRAVGVTIAKIGPHGGMAIPGDSILRLLPDLQAGRLARNWDHGVPADKPKSN